MAAHQVDVARASFAASLLRPDPKAVTRDNISQFHKVLDATLMRCSTSNVQQCKAWLVEHVLPSQGRVTALAKYFSALGPSSTDQGSADPTKPTKSAQSPRKKRLSILYILNDILYHAKHQARGASYHSSLAGNLQPFLVALLGSAASFDKRKKPRHHARIQTLLDIWEEQGYQSRDFISKLRQTIENASNAAAEGQELAVDAEGVLNTDAKQLQAQKEAPFIMPASHGDNSLPWYDLPAGNLMPHIVPNSAQPINPQLVRPLQFTAGPADESLALVIKDFLKDVEGIYTRRDYIEDKGIVADIDEMGQPLVKDEVTGEFVATEGYYGWSVSFCERMKRRKKEGFQPATNGTGRGRSRSRSSSRNSGSHKRRRYSSSNARSRSRSSSRAHLSRGSNRPRNRSQSRGREAKRSRSGSQSRSAHVLGERHSTQPELHAQGLPNAPPGPGLVPRPPSGNWHYQSNAPNAAFVTPANQITDPFNVNTAPPPAPTVPNASQFQHNLQSGPGGLPIPPPPPFHQGPWPPPPPPMPAGGFGPSISQNMSPYQQNQSFVPPPPPGQYGQQQYQPGGFPGDRQSNTPPFGRGSSIPGRGGWQQWHRGNNVRGRGGNRG